MAKKLKDAEIAEMGSAFVNSSSMTYDLANATVFDLSDAKDVADLQGKVRSITPGLVLSKGQTVILLSVLMVPTDNKLQQTGPFNRRDRKEIPYAVLDVNGRIVKTPIENLINPVSPTGIIETKDGEEIAKVTKANTNPDFIQMKGQVTDLLPLQGKGKTVGFALTGYSKMVTATAGEDKGKPVPLHNLNSYWFEK